MSRLALRPISLLLAGIGTLFAALGIGLGGGPAVAATLTPITGAGSTYVGLAMRQWVAQGNAQGLRINYTPSGSPAGLSLYGQTQTTDFAGTEAEFRSIPGGGDPPRGYQYVPDVAGATAIMYNVSESSGRKVDYLHLDAKTVARIFMGTITNWSDPAISRTNKGIKFPNQPIRVVLRGNPSGTTALFYDFIAHTLGSEYTSRFSQLQCGDPSIRPVQISCTPPLISNTIAFNDSDQIAQYVANNTTGKWSIGFDEFGYAKLYNVPTAWIQNASGKYVLPYAQNISAALESAKLRSDLSQDLSGVYASRNSQAYPISAYSYIVTQCAPTSARPTCLGAYPNVGTSNTLAAWMRLIACDGQVTMAQQGYSPLPTNLSQEMANSVGRLTGAAPAILTASNCANPRFKGSLGAGSISPCDPFLCSNSGSSTGGGGTSTSSSSRTSSSTRGSSGSGGTATTTGTTGATTGTTSTGVQVIKGKNGEVVSAIGGGSDAANWRNAKPVAFNAPIPDDPFGSLPAILVFAAVTLPALILLATRDSRRRKAAQDARGVARR